MKNLIQVAKNKYFLVTCFFLVWIGFFDQNDWVTRKSIDKEIREIVAEAADFSRESPEPDPSELYTDVFVDA